MPVTRNPAGASAALRWRTFQVLRLLGVALAVLFALFCVLLLLLRYVVMPQLPNHREQLAGMLSSRIGAPVTIDSLQTGWDGWNPKLVVDGFRVGQPGGAAGVSVLELPHVELVASWISLPLLQLRLKALLVERPRLAIRRDPGGRIHIAGLEIDPATAGDDSAFTDWLLRQREIVVRDALITWNDEHRNAPQLVLDRVQFRLENELLHHRFGLTGVPPADLASPLDFRGDITGISLSDWQRATGNLYLRLDYADVAAWGQWIPMPVHMDSGKGALRMWFDFGNGVARSVTSDIELADVSLQVEAGLPPLKLLHLAGRMDWREDAEHRTVSGNSVAFTTHEGSTQPPTDFTWTVNRGADGATTGGRFTFSRAELATLASVAEQLPLPADWRKLLAERAPHGALANAAYHWQGTVDAPQQWEARADLVEVGMRGDRTWPGASNISGTLDTANDHGSLRLVSRMATVDAPRVLHEPLLFDALDGALTWKRSPDGLQLDIANLAFANVDVAGSVSGTWRELADTPGEVNLTATLARVNVARLGPYLGAAFGDPARDWFSAHFTQGTLSDGHIAWAGNLAEFPSSGNHHGMFSFDAKLAGVGFTPGAQWPGFTDLDGSLQVDRTHIAADIARGHILDATINHATVDIPDVNTPTVDVSLDVAGHASTFLAFVAQSPVAGWIDHHLDDGKATGDGTLTAEFKLPLATHEPATFSGLYTFGGNDLSLPGAPALGAVTGTLRFNEHGIVSGNLAGNAFGGPATIDVAGDEGKVHVNASGVANLDTLHRTYPLPLVDRVGGHTDWQFAADVRQGDTTWTIDAPMKGASINLPAPLGKTTESAMPVRIERHQVAGKGDHDIVTLDVRNIVRLTINRHFTASGDAIIDRALALVGKAVEKPGDSERTGAWIRAVLPKVDLDEWWAVRAGEPTGDERPPMAIRLMGIDIAAAQATAMERVFHGVEISARSNQENWDLDLAGTDFEGTAQWQAPTPALPNGRLVARLARLRIPQSPEASSVVEAASVPHAADKATRWPEIDVDATHFMSGTHEVGRLQLRAQPSGSDWLIKELNITNDGGTLAATGRWQINDRHQQTDVKAKLDTKDAGAFLMRFGYPEAIRGAPTQIEGTLSWAGAPSEFDYPTLSGTLQLHTGAGQFTKIDPGLGKLLGVLSLQALPRRIELDFRDVFSEGFAFDEANGSVHIANGVLRTDDFTILGPAARVTIRGEADLAHETQQLMVRIQPSLATSFSAGTAGAAMLLLAANPVVAAVVGASTLLAQKVLQDPIESLFSYEYKVTGSWTDPVVVRVDGHKVAPNTTANPAAGGAASMAPGAGAKPAADAGNTPTDAAPMPADAATKAPADATPKGQADSASKPAAEAPPKPAAGAAPAPGTGTPASSPAS